MATNSSPCHRRRLVQSSSIDAGRGNAPALQVGADARAAPGTGPPAGRPGSGWSPCRGGRSGRGRSPRRRAAGSSRSGTGGSCSRLGPARRDGEQRSLHTGSSSTRRPSISTSADEWPNQVTCRPSASAPGGGATTGIGWCGCRALAAASARRPAWPGIDAAGDHRSRAECCGTCPRRTAASERPARPRRRPWPWRPSAAGCPSRPTPAAAPRRHRDQQSPTSPLRHRLASRPSTSSNHRGADGPTVSPPARYRLGPWTIHVHNGCSATSLVAPGDLAASPFRVDRDRIAARRSSPGWPASPR